MIATFVVFRAMLTPIDVTIIILYLLFSLGVGLYFTRRASRSTADYFTGGRNVSWWLGGLGLSGKLKLVLDRTDWMLGSTPINILTLAVVSQGSTAIPLLFYFLPHKGCFRSRSPLF